VAGSGVEISKILSARELSPPSGPVSRESACAGRTSAALATSLDRLAGLFHNRFRETPFMHRDKLALMVLVAIAASPSALSAQSAGEVSRDLGVWRNPKDSVHVEIRGCGVAACGYVIWANATAQADARKGGADTLIGMKVLRDLIPEKANFWRGKAYAPDLNMTFSGTVEFLDATTMRAKGCLIGGFLCKSQLWRRVDSAAS
jgi:uncharacterized protein (DUF2147 family)